MSELLSFLASHWVLTTLLFFIVGYLMLLENKGKVAGLAQVNPAELVTCLNHKKGIVLDLREQAEFEAGHIIKARRVDPQDLEKTIKSLRKQKTHPVVLCPADKKLTTNKVAHTLREAGFQDVRVLADGFSAWELAGMPIVKGQ